MKLIMGSFVDKIGLIRLKGRLEYSNLPLNTKFPIVLPKCSFIAELIIEDAHRKIQHRGKIHDE